MAAKTSALRSTLPNRRRRVRHKIQTPAYATFSTQKQTATLDLHEIIDISEEGVAIQCHAPLEVEQPVDLCLDLAECEQPIYTTGQVIWINGAGRAGLRFSALPAASLLLLREWLFLNAMAGVANAEAGLIPFGNPSIRPRADYTDTLAAVTAVQREVETLGPDLGGALQLIVGRAETLLRASGAAIALATGDPNFMDCRASAGPGAPPVGARLQVGSGFSGECVKTGRLLRCDDSDTDSRVDAESCRALGLRSILAAPVRVGEKSIGILEAFSPQPNAFSEADSHALQRLAETVLAAVNRAARAEDLPTLDAPPVAARFEPTPGSVLFASPAKDRQPVQSAEQKHSSGISLPLSHLVLLICAAITISLVLGVISAPWIQARLEARGQSHLQTVFASSQSPKPETVSPPAVETATMDQLRQMADKGDPAAENTLGLRYFLGDEKSGIPQDEKEAIHWFISAADHGNVRAQYKLGLLYWRGDSVVPHDAIQAYFWTILARAGGERGSKDVASAIAAQLTRYQVATVEQKADAWLRAQNASKLTSDH